MSYLDLDLHTRPLLDSDIQRLQRASLDIADRASSRLLVRRRDARRMAIATVATCERIIRMAEGK